MSHDSFRERKSEKYENPIPSREFILEYLTKQEKPANRKEIAAKLNIKDENQTKALHRRLRAMERDGQLVFTRYRNYVLPKHVNLLRGTVIGHRDGYGFLRVEGRKSDLYLSCEQMKICIHGDQVLAKPLYYDKKGRCEARIVRILVPKTSKIVGRYFVNSGIGFVIPEDSRLNFNIFIPKEEVMGAREGFVVVVELVQRLTHCTKAIGKIVEVLGRNMTTNMAVVLALRSHEIPYIWPKSVKKQIEDLQEEVLEEEKEGRIDLRNIPLITIDGEDAHDFDDAVYCEKKQEGGWRLLVAIADVSYYVRPYTPIDNEARNRGTSVYFPSQVILMLPELLSNGLCSLKPKLDRLCMVCEMIISSKGEIKEYKFYEAVMNSHARLTYSKVWNILQGDQDLRKKYAPLVMHIQELYNLYKVLEKARESRGSIFFESEEIKFIFNTEFRVQHIEQERRNEAHKLIEECMILTNISAANFVECAKEPALFRIHEEPTNEAITTFRSILAEFDPELSRKKKLEPQDYVKLSEFTSDYPNAEILQSILLRSMKQAIYNPENRGHFGLALESYTHFTSPIRRYPDLSLHRIIKYLIAKKVEKKENITNTGAYRYSMNELFRLGKHCSMTERRADNATREVADWLKCDFMLNQIGNFFKGVISTVTSFGFFVRLNEFFIDGLVHISTLESDHYHFDHTKQCLTGEFNGEIYRIGDHVEVCLKDVNIDARKLNFILVSSKHV